MGTYEDVKAVMRELRKRGYIARGNFSCCRGCAGYELTCEAVERVKVGRPIVGCVFWTQQDEACRKRTGRWHLSYGPLHSKELGQIGKEAVDIGHEVMRLLTKHGVHCEWTGDPGERIWVHVETARERREREREESLLASVIGAGI